MDALSEPMRAVRVTGALFFNGEFAAPAELGDGSLPSLDRCIAFLDEDRDHYSPGILRLPRVHPSG
jgi:hypothetical protein